MDSTLELEQLRTIDKRRIKDLVGKLSVEDCEKVREALRISLAI